MQLNKIKNSLVLKITLAYVLLTLINLMFFSVMIIENQTDLIITNFKHEANNLAKSTLTTIQGLENKNRGNKKKYYQSIDKALSIYELNSYIIFHKDGNIQVQKPTSSAKKVPPKLLQKVSQLYSENSLLQTPYLLELNKNNFSITLLFPLSKKEINSNFILVSMNLQSIYKRIQLVYFQVLGAILWGILFHILFGLFLIRIIFRRITLLVKASQDMEIGDLSARVSWKMNKKNLDELDTLGTSFNSMAESVEEKVTTITNQIQTISNLNKQIQQELKIGKEVQELLITAPKEVIIDFNPFVYYRPLREVSGDMFHYFRYQDKYRGVFFADASGHGVPAALVTAISFLSLEDVLKRDLPREKLMDVLNDDIASRMQQAFYLTAAFILFDDKGKVWLTNAGHNTFFIISSKGEIREIESDGLPVGVLPGSEYPVRTQNVQKGDKIFIYSDGLVETTNEAKKEFGIEKVKSILRDKAQKTSFEIGEEMKTQFNTFAKNFTDDVTFLCLEVTK